MKDLHCSGGGGSGHRWRDDEGSSPFSGTGSGGGSLSRLRLGIEMLPAEPSARHDLEQDIEDINSVISQFMDFVVYRFLKRFKK